MSGMSGSGSPSKRERSERFGGVSWYDLLGVSPDATPQQIKAAWREATDKFEPGSGTGQFRLFNEAADVLLDPTRRAAYDVERSAGGDPGQDSVGGPGAQTAVVLEPTPEPVPAVVLDEAPAAVEERGTSVPKPADPTAADREPTADEISRRPRRRLRSNRLEGRRWRASATNVGRPVPAWLMAVLAVLSALALALGGALWVQHRQHQQKQDAAQEASAAAERALPVVLSYDYRHLEADRDQAARFLSSTYKKEYTATFDKLIESSGNNPGPAEQTKAVVKATVENIGVVDAETGRAKVIVFLNQATIKDGGTPKYSLNRLTISMVKSGNTWLVDNIDSY